MTLAYFDLLGTLRVTRYTVLGTPWFRCVFFHRFEHLGGLLLDDRVLAEQAFHLFCVVSAVLEQHDFTGFATPGEQAIRTHDRMGTGQVLSELRGSFAITPDEVHACARRQKTRLHRRVALRAPGWVVGFSHDIRRRFRRWRRFSPNDYKQACDELTTGFQN